jgi:cytochrome c biogenesis protein CcmG, thiol:disulfide interchange protein DsbE
MKRALTVSAVLALALLASPLAADDPKPGTKPSAAKPAEGPQSLVGKAVPKFKMTDLKGKTLTPESLKGKVYLVDFWATWCGPCREASPILQQLHEKYGERGLVVIGANTSERGQDGKPLKTKEKAAAYAKEHKFTYTFTYANEDFAKACQVRGIPTMLVVDRSGVVRKVQVGFNKDLFKMLETAILPLLDDAG